MKFSEAFDKPLPPLETPQQREARMAEFRKRFPALTAAAAQGRFVQEGADHDPEDRTLIWEPRDE